MTHAQEIARQALARASARRPATLADLDKSGQAAHLEQARAAFEGDAVLYAAAPPPARRKHRHRPSLIDQAFAKVLEDGAALLAGRGHDL